jgi:hypothetical protein
MKIFTFAVKKIDEKQKPMLLIASVLLLCVMFFWLKEN